MINNLDFCYFGTFRYIITRKITIFILIIEDKGVGSIPDLNHF